MRNRSISKILLLTLALLMLCAPALGEDTPVYATEVVLHEGDAPTGFRVYPTEERDPEFIDMVIYRMEYDLPDGTPAPEALLFPSFAEGGMESTLHFVDLNADGYMDIEAYRAAGAANMTATYFICHGESGLFTEAKALSEMNAYTIYAEQKLLVGYTHDSAATGVYAMFRWGEDGYTPYLYRKASFLADERDNFETYRDLVVEYDESGAEVAVYRDESCPMEFDEADWNARSDERMRLFWQGFEQPVASAQ